MYDLTEVNRWLDEGQKDTLSIVIPSYNEADNLPSTLAGLYEALTKANIQHELLVVNDNSSDGTLAVLRGLKYKIPTLTWVNNNPPNGFGLAVRKGLKAFKGDAVAIVMADGSDAPEDVVRFYQTLQQGYDCVFGSRFMKGGKVIDYPTHKRLLNRVANHVIRLMMQIKYNDMTNAFKCYRRHVIAGVQPLIAHHFNLTVEIPLKAIIRGFSYTVVPNSWTNRKMGVSKLKIREMGSRYLFILLYCLIEKWLSRGDYHLAKTYKSLQKPQSQS